MNSKLNRTTFKYEVLVLVILFIVLLLLISLYARTTTFILENEEEIKVGILKYLWIALGLFLFFGY